MPARPSYAWNRQWRRRQVRNAPARDGRGRLTEVSGFRLAPPAADDDADGTGRLGGELQAARGRHGQFRDICDCSAKPAMAKALLETGERGLLIARFHVDDAAGFEAGLSERRGEEIGPSHAPKNRPLRAGGDAGREERRSCTIYSAVAASGHFMQCPESEATTWQPVVYRTDSKRQNSPSVFTATLDPADLLAQDLDGSWVVRCDRHGACISVRVGVSFLLCSYLVARVNWVSRAPRQVERRPGETEKATWLPPTKRSIGPRTR